MAVFDLNRTADYTENNTSKRLGCGTRLLHFCWLDSARCYLHKIYKLYKAYYVVRK